MVVGRTRGRDDISRHELGNGGGSPQKAAQDLSALRVGECGQARDLVLPGAVCNPVGGTGPLVLVVADPGIDGAAERDDAVDKLVVAVDRLDEGEGGGAVAGKA